MTILLLGPGEDENVKSLRTTHENGDHTYYLNNFESPTPKDDSCQVWLKSDHAFSRGRWKCKKFTHDARKRTAVAHLSLRLRWAKKLKKKKSTSNVLQRPSNIIIIITDIYNAPCLSHSDTPSADGPLFFISLEGHVNTDMVYYNNYNN